MEELISLASAVGFTALMVNDKLYVDMTYCGIEFRDRGVIQMRCLDSSNTLAQARFEPALPLKSNSPCYIANPIGIRLEDVVNARLVAKMGDNAGFNVPLCPWYNDKLDSE